MNKKKLFSLAMLVMVLTAVLSVRANATDRFTPPFPIFQSIAFQVRIFDPTIGNNPFPKSPVEEPEVYISDHALAFDESCGGCTLNIVNGNNEVEYTTIISSETIVLPSTLEGDYEIQIIRDNWCFYGLIEL